jgi:hypothetical protein
LSNSAAVLVDLCHGDFNWFDWINWAVGVVRTEIVQSSSGSTIAANQPRRKVG